jgi:sporulation protein YlmC with PRC-barrel domain
MIAARSLEGKPIISLTDGKKIAQVRDLYLDAEGNKVVAVIIGHEGVINRKAIFIERASIAVFGIDAWLTTGPNVALTELPKEQDAADWLVAGHLRGREINTDGGTKIGTVGDVLLDVNMKVIGFGLDKVYVKGPLAERRHIARSAVRDLGMLVTSLGGRDQPMIIDLSKAEMLPLPG